MKVVVYTLGCKVNSVESRGIMRELELLGCEAVDTLEKADAYILNTCSVTSEADRKCRQTVGKIVSLDNAARIYIIGCSSQNHSQTFARYENVKHISGNGNKRAVIGSIMSDVVVKNPVCMSELPSKFEEFNFPVHSKTREFIKIQDGCNNFCSYCIVPHLRGRERSRSIDSIALEAEAAARICKEIVLTGINVSSFGKDSGESLLELFVRLGKLPVRKRLSSLECGIISEELLSKMQSAGFCDHFHLSLQSGSDEILRKMNRHYTAEQYLDKVKLIRKYFPNAGLTTDIIVGFPGESELNFEETVAFARLVRFSNIHVFPYSVREGTAAAKMTQLPMELRRERAGRLSRVRDELSADFLRNQLGKTLSVYTESGGEGYAGNYVRVYTDKTEGDVSDIKIKSLYKKGVR